MRERLMDLSGRLHHPAIGGAVAKWVEALLILLLIVQIARFFWAVVTPLGMFGEWTARQPALLAPSARQALFSTFDPFFREDSGQAGSAQVTSLALQLFGTRMNEGSGQGAAIIATPDGMQSSYVVGDVITPGVVLKAISYDHVVLGRGGVVEKLFLDQSSGGGTESGGTEAAAGGARPAPDAPDSAVTQKLTAETIMRDIAFAPRTDAGRVTGIIVSSKGSGSGFAEAGFQNGDIVIQVNGRPISSAADLQNIQAQLKPGARLSFMVERGAATVPIAVNLSEGQ